MNLNLMDGKLSCGISLSIRLTGEIFNLLKYMDDRIETFLYEEGDRLFIHLYFRKTTENYGKYNLILSHKSLRESKFFFTVSEEIKNPKYLNFLKEILNFPSVVLAGTFMKDGSLFILFRYHENYKSQLNSMLNSYMLNNNDVEISEIRKSHTFKDRMMRINKSAPLSVLQTSSRYISNELISYVYKNSPGFIAELEGRGLTSEGVRALIYAESELNYRGLNTISGSQHIYEARHYESLFLERRQLANQDRIPRIAILFTVKEDRAYITTFLPVEEMDNYMRIYSRTLSKETSYEPKIEVLSEVKEDVWNWLE